MRYTVQLTFDRLTMTADMAQASWPIGWIDDDGEQHTTQYQTADARHDLERAAVLLVSTFGRDWWCGPDDDPKDDDEYIRDLIVDIEPDDDDDGEQESCMVCGEAIDDEATAMGWPIPRLTDGLYVCPDCYGDEAYCPDGHVLDAHSDSGQCRMCTEVAS